MKEKGQAGIEILHQFGIVLPPVNKVVNDGGRQVDDIVVELLGEALFAVRIQPIGCRQMFNHGLGHQLQEEPAGFQSELAVFARCAKPLESQLFMYEFGLDCNEIQISDPGMTLPVCKMPSSSRRVFNVAVTEAAVTI